MGKGQSVLQQEPTSLTEPHTPNATDGAMTPPLTDALSSTWVVTEPNPTVNPAGGAGRAMSIPKFFVQDFWYSTCAHSSEQRRRFPRKFLLFLAVQRKGSGVGQGVRVAGTHLFADEGAVAKGSGGSAWAENGSRSDGERGQRNADSARHSRIDIAISNATAETWDRHTADCALDLNHAAT